VLCDTGNPWLDMLLYFLALVTAGCFILPEEVIVIDAGLWAANYTSHNSIYWVILPIIWTGVVLSDGLFYTAGRYYGTRLLKIPLLARLMPPDKVVHAEENFERYGVVVLLIGRLLPGVRLPLFVSAGILRLPVAKVVLADGLGAVVGNSLMFFCLPTRHPVQGDGAARRRLGEALQRHRPRRGGGAVPSLALAAQAIPHRRSRGRRAGDRPSDRHTPAQLGGP